MTIDLKAIKNKYFRIFCKRDKLRDYFTIGGFDVTFLAILIVILATGLIMMFSASYVNAWYDAGSTKTGGDPYYYFKHQILYTAIGIVLMFIVSHIRADFFEDASILALIVAIALLAAVLIHPMNIAGKEDFKRWLYLPVIGSFQPSEVAKLALIMYLSWSLSKHQKLVEKEWWAVIPHFMIIAVVCVLVLLENHLSGTILIFGIGVVLTYLGGGKRWIYIAGAGVVVVGAIVVISSGLLKSYASSRIDIWLKLLTNKELTRDEKLGQGWQIMQSLYAIGSGGMFGLGFGNSKQKHLYLPEPQNDFVFAIVCEELGYVRAVLIMVLFILLVARGFKIAMRSRSRFGALLAMGISFQVGLQALLNIAVVTGTIPNTGIGLPFFSYGGSSMLTLLVEMGMVLSVSRGTGKTVSGKDEEK